MTFPTLPEDKTRKAASEVSEVSVGEERELEETRHIKIKVDKRTVDQVGGGMDFENKW